MTTTATTQLSTTPSPVVRSRSSQELASGRGGGGGRSPAGESDSRALLLPPQSATMQNLAVFPNGGGSGANNGHIRKVSVETHESGAEDS